MITRELTEALRAMAKGGEISPACSLDLGRTTTTVEPGEDGFTWEGQHYRFPLRCKDRTIYFWTGEAFEPAARFGDSLVKLVPTEWGPPTFEIDGIKMLPTAQVCPWEDARRKVALVEPRDKVVLDTCGGLGYFAAWCLELGAARVLSFEKNPDVLWLRSLNPWSPRDDDRLALVQGEVAAALREMADASIDAALHDPPRFGIAGELYSQGFYDDLARVLRLGGRLFHYTGNPNALTSGRDVPREVMKRLRRAGFVTRIAGDGVLATRR